MHIESATLTNHLVLCHSPSFCLPSFPAPFQCVDFCIRWPKHWSFSSSLCAFNEYSGLICFRIDRCYLQWTFKSFSTSQFESLSSSALSLLYGPTLTSIQNYWKKQKFDCMNICWQSDVSTFLLFNMLSRFLITFQGASVFNVMAAVTIHSDFGAQENKICYCFHIFLFSLPWSDGTRCHGLSILYVEFQASFFTLLFHPNQEAL